MGNGINCQAKCKKTCVAADCDAADAGLEADDRKQEVVDITSLENKATAPPYPTTSEPAQARLSEQQAFEVVVVRAGKHWKTLGVLVSPDDDPRYLMVDDIWEPSLVSEWNAAQPEDKRVKSGDTITGVNGSSCNGEQMLSKIQAIGQGQEIRLSVRSAVRALPSN